ncbi:hypothetical protein [Sphingomonas sp. PAMC 26605]|uniref:hypothetical protein n=1 Tax=Sphingomonas sp. PAMC 26605 TaxID=1112214 RepID=UPI0012F50255|nr:hypothetical protein [Sphingomonas sp. PAMC 26605]
MIDWMVAGLQERSSLFAGLRKEATPRPDLPHRAIRGAAGAAMFANVHPQSGLWDAL